MDLASALAATGSDDVSDPSDFPENFGDLRTLDRTLRCPICKDLFNAPVLLATCGHSFCSLCIREALKEGEKKECPACRIPTQESSIKKNIVLEESVEAYKGARSNVLFLANDAVSRKRRREESANGTDETPRPKRMKRQSSDHVLQSVDEDDERPEESEDSEVEILDSNALVDCPICNHKVLVTRINAHIDAGCPEEQLPSDKGKGKVQWAKLLAGPGGKTGSKFGRRGAGGDTDRSSSPPPRPLAKVSYHTLSNKQVRMLLQTQGLAETGDRKQWEQRHAQWITLYNANLDSSKAKSTDQLKRDLDKWERLRARDEKEKEARMSRVDAKGYEKSQNEHFAKLIVQARASVQGKSNGTLVKGEAESDKPIEISSDVETV
ncbi:hypothetical protein DACRYDRAFT_113608 [Dacryopinax primogenitus]|uniref:Postreplication repair E3 ubiquitin-protein ligase RAD18 n=1 Tax=Dacryopinax primogenitus (strain DJM 731) TaxID=1858805 RepID=M5GEL7_DACPD|nr:uncharacterized protein DACRYDRAFT_113608 [Dacryopinax primogenitus]EJU05522.1 hypothetical protein DACRYDRAFT_113608 [Dacryopinax primogenitus]